MKIGVMFGNPETTTGGNALKFYATQRLDIRRIGAIKDGDQVIGNRTRVKVVKNKVAPPFKEVEFDIMYGRIARGDLLDLGSNENIVKEERHLVQLRRRADRPGARAARPSSGAPRGAAAGGGQAVREVPGSPRPEWPSPRLPDEVEEKKGRARSRR